jgi:hypothetical protein
MDSAAGIETLAGEICASVPQLADYLEHLPSYFDGELDAASKRAQVLKHKAGRPMLSLSLTTATVELSTHFIYDPGPFKKTSPRPKPSGIPQPRPDSLYHIYYQLCHLESIPVLQVNMKNWIQGRLRWIEEVGDAEDLDLMQALLRRSLAGSREPQLLPTFDCIDSISPLLFLLYHTASLTVDFWRSTYPSDVAPYMTTAAHPPSHPPLQAESP